MKFTPQELNKIGKDKIFTKKIKNRKYWVKPLIEHSSYPLGNIKSHRSYFQALKKYLFKHIPETKFLKVKGKKITLILQKDIVGKRVGTLREIKSLFDLKQNKEFRNGLKNLLEKKKWVIDLYVYKKNFIVDDNTKLYFIDGRMPVFPDPKEERFQIAKKRTMYLLKKNTD